MDVRKRRFNGSMNLDLSPHLDSKGSVRLCYDLIFLPDDDGKGGVWHDADGARFVAGNFSGPGEDAVVVGAVEDVQYDRVIYFIYNSAGNDVIALFQADGSSYIVLDNSMLEDTTLLFDKYTFIHASVTDGILVYCNGANDIRMIDIDAAALAKNPAYVSPRPNITAYNTPLRGEDLALIRRPPMLPPSVTKGNSSTFPIGQINRNFIERRALQFAFRYTYKNGETSVLSPYSVFLAPNNDSDTFDSVKVVMSKSELVPSTVEKLDVLVRIGVGGKWFIFDSKSKTANASEFSDHNNSLSNNALTFYYGLIDTGESYPDEEAAKQVDAVPHAAQALTIANGAVVMANLLEGLDAGASAVPLSVSVPDEAISTGLPGVYELVGVKCDNPPQTQYVVVVKITGQGALDGYYVTNESESNYFGGQLPTEITVSATPQIPLGTNLIEYFSPCGQNYDPVFSFHDTAYSGTQPTVYGIDGVKIDDGEVILKGGARYRLGVVFFDFAGRTNGVVEDIQEVSVQIPDYNPATFRNRIEWSLPVGFHDSIPVWARYYSIVRTKDLEHQSFVSFRSGVIRYAQQDDAGLYSFTATTYDEKHAGIAVSIDNLLGQGMGYNFADGDLCVIVTDSNVKHTLRVLALSGKWLVLSLVNLGDVTSTVANVEIYTPAADVSSLFYETGETYNILNPYGGSRQFSVTGGVIMGDVYLKERTFGAGTVLLEAMSPNDTVWETWAQNCGRVFVEDDGKGQQWNPLLLRFSEVYRVGTSLNLNSVFEFNRVDMPVEMSAVRRLVPVSRSSQQGTVLLAIGENRCASLYVGATELIDTEGGSVLVSNQRFIGTINLLSGEYGTRHPESVAQLLGEVYFADATRRQVVRYTNAGLFPISDFGMRSVFHFYFEALNAYEQAGNQIIIPGGTDYFNREYVLSLPNCNNLFVDGTHSANALPVVLPEFTTQIVQHTIGAQSETLQTSGLLVAGELYEVDISLQSSQEIELFYGGKMIFNGKNASSYKTYFFCYEPTLSIKFNLPGGFSDAQGETVTINKVDVEFHENDKLNGSFVFSNDRWVRKSHHNPEMMGKLGNRLVVFDRGQAFVVDDDLSFGNAGLIRRIVVPFFIDESLPAVFHSLILASANPPNHVICYVFKPNVQYSDIVSGEFEHREGFYYAPVRRDMLSPNVSGSKELKMLEGDPIRSDVAFFLVKFDSESDLRELGVIIRHSRSHKR